MVSDERWWYTVRERDHAREMMIDEVSFDSAFQLI